MDNPVLQIVMRYIHIFSAVLAVGGVSFMGMCLLPALKKVTDADPQILATAQSRFARVLWGSIAGLVISGAYNWILRVDVYKAMGPLGNALIGSKVLVAVILFAILGALQTGLITAGTPRMWRMINVHLAALVILLGSVLRILSIKVGG